MTPRMQGYADSSHRRAVPATRPIDMVLTMSTGVVITVTWMDGKVEIYRDVGHRVQNGVLMIDQSKGSAGLPLPNQRELYLPLANIRTVAVDQR